MYSNTPKDAIIAFLIGPVGGFTAKPGTIRSIKERSLPHRQLHFVTFEDEDGIQMHCFYHVEEVDNGKWRINGGYGESARGWSRHSSPRAYIGGTASDTNEFEAGGSVEHNEYTIARVQLVSANNIVLEDTVEHDVVLFLSDQFIKFPIEARLYDAQGALLNAHPVFSG